MIGECRERQSPRRGSKPHARSKCLGPQSAGVRRNIARGLARRADRTHDRAVHRWSRQHDRRRDIDSHKNTFDDGFRKCGFCEPLVHLRNSSGRQRQHDRGFTPELIEGRRKAHPGFIGKLSHRETGAALGEKALGCVQHTFPRRWLRLRVGLVTGHIGIYHDISFSQ